MGVGQGESGRSGRWWLAGGRGLVGRLVQLLLAAALLIAVLFDPLGLGVRSGLRTPGRGRVMRPGGVCWCRGVPHGGR
ncbi:hypothetical protein [Streptomyces sp. NPDC057580]|uniref:hypothetical protein n=1 Tax=Streptomyces sp. NPDC057580 TaxID=3346173 RepID=UPI0036AB25C7